MSKLFAFKHNHIFLLFIVAFCFGETPNILAQNTDVAPKDSSDTDSINHLPVRDINNDVFNEKTATHIDLKDPDNLSKEVVFDPITGKYIMLSKIGDIDVGLPAQMDYTNYEKYELDYSLSRYWAERNSEERGARKGPLELKFDLGPAGAIFGKGGVKLKPQGFAELTFGIKTNEIDNPTIPERLRKTTVFDFDNKIQMNVKGSVGERINFGMSYNTEATFDFDNQINLNYEGDEDDIIQKVEAGNVSMPLSGSLIKGSQSLFGFKTELQFGKLTATTVVSQQESETQSMTLQGGATTSEYEIKADEYDANRNFFLTHFFENNYDSWMSNLPVIMSGVTINRIEVWITNRRGDFDEARNIVAFMDLGESTTENLNNTHWSIPRSGARPDNDANSLYEEITSQYSGIRSISNVVGTLDPLNSQGIVIGEDYEKIENARRLTSNEYYLNPQLGYISLRSALNADEVLAVAFEYTYNGQVYQVGEFSTDGITPPESLVLKLLKGTNLTPELKNWKLMMKNIYSLGAYSLDKTDFDFRIMFRDDATGTELNYLPAGEIKEEFLLRVLGLDKLNARNEKGPDGFFDWVEGYTILQEDGKVIFPYTEPFGDVLAEKIGDEALAEALAFPELYENTITLARELAEKNKFSMEGTYKSASGSEIKLNAYNIPRGSVTVTAGGRELVENADYTIDYSSGYIKILNQGLLQSNTPINVSMENQANFSLQKKTMLGTHLDYRFNDDISVGATVLHLYERSLTQKVNVGDDPISNTIIGFNGSLRKDLPFLTRWVDAIPFIETKAPSSISVKGEFAQLIPGHSKSIGSEPSVYVDDFEATKIGIDISRFFSWKHASTPLSFSEATLSNDLQYNYNRARISWYTVDRMFQTPNNLTPSYISSDEELRSNHFTRAVNERNLFPNKDNEYGEPTILPVLNVSYYPNDKGIYNFTRDLKPNGRLQNPKSKWGGIQRQMETSDFEAANIEYIEFWMMDPFVYDSSETMGGDLIFNLGNISEDILKDGRKSFENGLPNDGSLNDVDSTVWGLIPTKQSMVNAFDTEEASRVHQDVGLDGLSAERELLWHAEYVTFLNNLYNAAAPLDKPYIDSLRLDPAQDNYSYFRGSDLDNYEVSILDRYKRYNNLEGNSPTSGMSNETYPTSATTVPDIEDINQDNTLSENESYFAYKINLRPGAMEVGSNNITDIKTETVKLANGNTESVRWYQFKVPIYAPDSIVGKISDYRSIRFLRMYLKRFQKDVHLRFAKFDLVRGEWRVYNEQLFPEYYSPTTTLETGAVNIEENSDRSPVNYVLPPGVNRMIDPGQPQLRQLNEQAMVIRVNKLRSKDARATYKTLDMDFRQFKKLQLWSHAEEFLPENQDWTNLENGELKLFVRIGSDFKNNYYEYELPLVLTPHRSDYDGAFTADRETVWPIDNRINIALQDFIDLKLDRNSSKRSGNIDSYLEEYPLAVEGKPGHFIKVKGNPTLSKVRTIMIGVKNDVAQTTYRSGEVWVNELRLTEFNNEGGWAGMGNMSLKFADLGSVNMSGRKSTSGFGGLEEKLMERSLEDQTTFDISTNVELGKFFPKKAKVSLPLYYSYSRDVINPKYNPLDEDVELQQALDNATGEDKEEIKQNAQVFTESKSFNLSNVKVNYSGKKKRFYDPANFGLNFGYSESSYRDPKTEYEKVKNYKGGFNYGFAPNVKPFMPLRRAKLLQSDYLAIIRDFNLNYAPQQVSFQTDMSRSYNENQLRDLSDSGLDIPVAVRKDWYWNFKYDITWNPMQALTANLSMTNNSIIDEPYLYTPDGMENTDDYGRTIQLDKYKYAGMYEFWKDSVMRSIQNLGRVTLFNQSFNARYSVPLQKIAAIDWVTLDGGYNATYNWERGPNPFFDEDSVEHILGNNIRNTQTKTINGSFSLNGLYNKSKYLKDVNSKYGKIGGLKNKKRYKNKKYNKDGITLKKGEVYVVKHNLGSEKANIRFYNIKDRSVSGKKKVIDENTVEFTPRLDVDVARVEASARVEDVESFTDKVFGYSTRFMMMLKNVSFNYTETNSLTVPGFKDQTGHFGQSTNGPGWGFAFGDQRLSIIDDLHRKQVLATDTLLNNPYMQANSVQLGTRASFEPLNGLKIDLTTTWSKSKMQRAYYFYDDADYGKFNSSLNPTQTGNFTMTWMALGVPWEIGSDANYSSSPFDKLIENRSVIATRLASERQKSTPGYDPNEDGTGYSNYNLNSSEVLIPAFLSAYGGKNANAIGLSPFPSMTKVRPNWSVKYTGLSKLSFFKQYFKSISLSHAYRSTYNVGSYNTNLNYDADYLPTGAEEYFVNPYDITTVSISEAFSPLFNIDMAWKNSITTRLEYNKTRTLNLNIASNQLVEMQNNEFVVGMGYRWSGFDMVVRAGSKAKNVNNDLTLRGDISWRDVKSLIRQIENYQTQPTSGQNVFTLKLSADYVLSRNVNIKLFYDRMLNKPLISSSYATGSSNFGMAFRVTLIE